MSGMDGIGNGWYLGGVRYKAPYGVNNTDLRTFKGETISSIQNQPSPFLSDCTFNSILREKSCLAAITFFV